MKNEEKKELPLVSIIVPIYKVEMYLDKCIESIMHQSEKNIEIILVDDGSPDNSPSICDRYAQIDPRVIVIHQINQGVSVARNAGIDRSTAELIMFVDGDDSLPVDAVADLLKYSNKCDFTVGYDQGAIKKCKSTENSIYIKCDQPEYDLIRRCVIGNLGSAKIFKNSQFAIFPSVKSPWGKIYKKSIIEENDIRFIPGVKRGQDILFNISYLSHIANLTVVNKVVYDYNQRVNSSVSSIRTSNSETFVGLLNHIKNVMCANGVFADEIICMAVPVFAKDLLRTFSSNIKTINDIIVTRKELKRFIAYYKPEIKKCRISDFADTKEKVTVALLKTGMLYLMVALFVLFYAIKPREEEVLHNRMGKRKCHQAIL